MIDREEAAHLFESVSSPDEKLLELCTAAGDAFYFPHTEIAEDEDDGSKPLMRYLNDNVIDVSKSTPNDNEKEDEPTGISGDDQATDQSASVDLGGSNAGADGTAQVSND